MYVALETSGNVLYFPNLDVDGTASATVKIKSKRAQKGSYFPLWNFGLSFLLCSHSSLKIKVGRIIEIFVVGLTSPVTHNGSSRGFWVGRLVEICRPILLSINTITLEPPGVLNTAINSMGSMCWMQPLTTIAGKGWSMAYKNHN